MEVDVRDTFTVCAHSWYRITKRTVVVASLVTENGRAVQGVGANRWSEGKATEAAIENAKRITRETDVGVKIRSIRLPNHRTQYNFLEEQSVVQGQHSPSFGGRPTIEVQVTDGDRTADGKGKQGVFSALFSLGPKNQFVDAELNAIEAAVADLQRTGRTTLD